MDKQILVEERIDNYAITNLPNEIIEMILIDVIKSFKNSTETYSSTLPRLIVGGMGVE